MVTIGHFVKPPAGDAVDHCFARTPGVSSVRLIRRTTTFHSRERAQSQGRIQRWGGQGSSPPTAAATMEPLLKPFLIFIGMKEIEEGL
jgi:hypothetical protein